MSTSRAFALTAALARLTLIFMFGLLVLGSVVRTTGSGLACPDWPLCEGRLLPRLEPHVLFEWSHRTLALLVSLCLLATTISVLARPAVRARLGALIGLAVALLFAQVLLGALTVWKLLSPSVVASHLAVALLLFATVLTLALVAQGHADAEAGIARPARPEQPALAAALAATSILAYGQAVLGGIVSGTHAVTACADWPTCRGAWLPTMSGLVGIQMAHRWSGYLVALAVLGVLVAARRAPRAVRGPARAASLLVVAQVALGVLDVLLQAPVWVSALHLATAVTLIGTLVTATFHAAAAPLPAMRLVPEEAL